MRHPRPILSNPVATAMHKASVLLPRERELMQRITRAALDDLRRGERPADAWATLADALNIAETLAGLGIASDEASRAKIDAGQHALGALALRHQAGRSWTMYPDEITALADAVEIHCIQLRFCSLGEFERAHQITARRIYQARMGNAPAGATVIHGAIGAREAA